MSSSDLAPLIGMNSGPGPGQEEAPRFGVVSCARDVEALPEQLRAFGGVLPRGWGILLPGVRDHPRRRG